MPGLAPRALLLAACCKGAVGGSLGNREVVVVRNRQTGLNVVLLPLPALEDLLTRACAAVIAQLRRSKTTTTEEARVPKRLSNNSLRALLLRFRSRGGRRHGADNGGRHPAGRGDVAAADGGSLSGDSNISASAGRWTARRDARQ